MLRSRRFGNLGLEQATCSMIRISGKDSGFCKLSVHMLTKVTPGQCQGEHEVGPDRYTLGVWALERIRE
jgi:hypothetical protein